MLKLYTLGATLIFSISILSTSLTNKNIPQDIENELVCCGTIEHDTVANPDGSTTTTTTTTITCDTPQELVDYLALQEK